MGRHKLTNAEELFQYSNSDPLRNVYIHPYKIYQWDLYAIGYKYAADRIIDNAFQDQYHIGIEYGRPFHKSDVLVWPVVFLYRQYLELRLKSINIRASTLTKIEDNSEVPSQEEMDFIATHDLLTSWKICKKLLEDRIEDKTELDVMEEYINQYSKMDIQSFTFRYPVNKSDKKPWEYKIRQFSLEILRDRMKNIFDFLEEQMESLDSEIQLQKELLSELRDLFGDWE